MNSSERNREYWRTPVKGLESIGVWEKVNKMMRELEHAWKENNS